jgi:hypothetical protein
LKRQNDDVGEHSFSEILLKSFNTSSFIWKTEAHAPFFSSHNRPEGCLLVITGIAKTRFRLGSSTVRSENATTSSPDSGQLS